MSASEDPRGAPPRRASDEPRERFDHYCRELVAKAAAEGWEERERRTIDYGRQYRLARGGDAVAILNCYHGKKGLSFVIAGALKDQLQLTLGGPPAGRDGAEGGSRAARKTNSPPSGVDPFALGFPRVGGDESGKGDYFGPLVAALYLVDEAHAAELVALGIADSKRLADPVVEALAGKLTATGRGVVVSLSPPDYNERYRAIGNINTLLGDLYAACWRELRERLETPPRAVLIDRYTPREADLRRRLGLPANLPLVMRPKGEADVAVAAASILARAAFLEGLRELGHAFGEEIPLGAGSPVLRFGRRFVRDFGAERLEGIAKLHFATTQQIGGRRETD